MNFLAYLTAPVALVSLISVSTIFQPDPPTEPETAPPTAVTVGTEAGPINWVDWNTAVAANSETPKLIFVDLYTDWCGWCKRMDATTFKNPVIAEYMNEHFYAVKMDAEMKDTILFRDHTFTNPVNPNARRNTHQLASSLLDGKLSYPSFVILDQNFNRLQILPGYRQAKEFEPILNFFGQKAYLDTPYDKFVANFESLLEKKETSAN